MLPLLMATCLVITGCRGGGEYIPPGENQQWVGQSSAFVVTLVAAHMEHVVPDGLPMQDLDGSADPVDFIHLRNVSSDPQNLAEWSLCDASHAPVAVRRLIGGRDVFVAPGGEIRILFSDEISQDQLETLSSAAVVIPHSLSRHGDAVRVFAPGALRQPIAVARSGAQDQDEVTAFDPNVAGQLVEGDLRHPTADELNAISHRLADWD